VLGLPSDFTVPIVVAAVVAAAFAVGAVVIALRRRRHRRPWVTTTARILTIGAALTAVAATGYPREGWVLASDGDLVLMPGRGGLANLDQILADPRSLAVALLLANVLLYVPIGFFGTFGWHRWRAVVLLASLALSIGVEALQFSVLGRVASIDSVMLNVGGALLGMALASIVLARLGWKGSLDRGLM
jgi:hypothetical protein